MQVVSYTIGGRKERVFILFPIDCAPREGYLFDSMPELIDFPGAGHAAPGRALLCELRIGK